MLSVLTRQFDFDVVTEQDRREDKSARREPLIKGEKQESDTVVSFGGTAIMSHTAIRKKEGGGEREEIVHEY